MAMSEMAKINTGISVHQTIKGDPNNGLDELEPTQSYLNHYKLK